MEMTTEVMSTMALALHELDTPVWSIIVAGSRDAKLVFGGTAGGEGVEWLADLGLEGVVTRDDMPTLVSLDRSGSPATLNASSLGSLGW